MPGHALLADLLFERLVERENVRLTVKDNGIGIREMDIPAALAPFGQVDQTLSREHEGAGLGLPLSKKFAEALGGNLIVNSTFGEGTTVEVTLPLDRAKPARQSIFKAKAA